MHFGERPGHLEWVRLRDANSYFAHRGRIERDVERRLERQLQEFREEAVVNRIVFEIEGLPGSGLQQSQNLEVHGKWNPIEHRLFSEISKNWAGEPLDSYEKILKFIRTTKTDTGLRVTAFLDTTHYQTGRKPDTEQLRQLRLRPHDTLPKWNYTIAPAM